MKYFLTIILCFSCSYSHAQWDILPARMYADSMAYPFHHGVASGDPLATQVIIWTKVEYDEMLGDNQSIDWEVSTTEDMSSVVQVGDFTTNADRDWTVKINVEGLQPYTHYYYQFTDELGNKSQIGHTKTAPTEMVEELKFATSSCSSIYSGFFNSYRLIAEREDLDAMIHVGDYIYDYPDSDELVRIPEPFPVDPLYLDEWRQLHRYYLLDPDLRAARQRHPFIHIWDNHDIDVPADLIGEAVQAWYEYVPMRQVDADWTKIYRKLQYGDLLDIIMLDTEFYQGNDSIAPGEYSILGIEQYDWLINQLESSAAKWRIFGSQKMFSHWSIEEIDFDLPIGNDSIIDPGSWDGYMLERENLLLYLEENELDNNIILTGDLHFAFAGDLAIYPFDSTAYEPGTGFGSVGVELMGGSLNRGNVDEFGYPPSVGVALANLSLSLNPHHVYANLIDHGYSVLSIKPDSTTAQVWMNNKLIVTEEEEMDIELICRDGENHWDRSLLVTSTKEVLEDQLQLSKIYPNPNTGSFQIDISSVGNRKLEIEVIEATSGRIVERFYEGVFAGEQSISFELNQLDSGIYFVRMFGEDFNHMQKMVVVE